MKLSLPHLNGARLLFSLLLFAGALQAPALAIEEPREKLKAAVEAVLVILDEEPPADDLDWTKRRLLEAMDGKFSFEVIVRRALGRNWNRLDEQQQQEVTDLLISLVLNTYAKEMSREGNVEVSIGNAVELARNRVEIPSQASFNGQTIKMAYRMARLESGWEVYDVLVEGISMVNNYRKQFEEHFRRRTAEDLIEILKTKLKEEA